MINPIPITPETIAAAIRILQGVYTASYNQDVQVAKDAGLIEFVRYVGYTETALLVEMTRQEN